MSLLRSTTQLPRHAPPSLSLGSLGVMKSHRSVSLTFRLEVEEDWPPVAAESLPFIQFGETYEAQAAPLFVKHLSVGDKIRLLDVENDQVWSWEHVDKSANSTVWLLRTDDVEVEPLLPPLHKIGCQTAWSSQCGVCSVNVPLEVDVKRLDTYLSRLESKGLAVAFPSWRHNDA